MGSAVERYLATQHTTPQPHASESAVARYLQSTGRQAQPTAPGSVDDADDSSILERVRDSLVSGLPGGRRAVAGFTGIGELVRGHGLQAASDAVEGSMARQPENVKHTSPYARIPLQIAGAIPAGVALAPLGIAGGGAAFGALEGADKQAASLKDRAINTAIGGGIGAVTAKGTQLAGRAIGNISNKIGLTDAIAKGVQKVSPELAETLGSRGQVNQAMRDRQDILDAIGDDGTTAGAKQLGRVGRRKATAKVLYNTARDDRRILDDPDLQALLSDPQVKQIYDRAAAIRSASGDPLPRVAAPDVMPAALRGTVKPENYARLMQLQKSRGITNSGIDALPEELRGTAAGVELPDPEVLHKVKRALSAAIKGRQDSDLPLSQDEAIALTPKLQAIRTKLHEISPAWKKADAYYARALGEESAYAQGYNAFKDAKNPSGKDLLTKSPDAMRQSISTPRYPGEPAPAMAARARAFREGTQGAASASVRNAPIDRGAGSVLAAKPFAATPNAAEIRSLMFEDPEHARTLEQLLGAKRAAVPSGGSGTLHSASRREALRALLQFTSGDGPDLLGTPTSQSLIAEYLHAPPSRATLSSVEQLTSRQNALAQLLSRLGGSFAATGVQ